MITILGIALVVGYIVGIVVLARHFRVGAKSATEVRPPAPRSDFVVWYYSSASEAQTRRRRIISKFELDPDKVVVRRKWIKSRNGKIMDAYAVVITDPAYCLS